MFHFQFYIVIVLTMTMTSVIFAAVNPSLQRNECLQRCESGLRREFTNLDQSGLDCAKYAVKKIIRAHVEDDFLKEYYELLLDGKFFDEANILIPGRFCYNQYEEELEDNEEDSEDNDEVEEKIDSCSKNLRIFGTRKIKCYKTIHREDRKAENFNCAFYMGKSSDPFYMGESSDPYKRREDDAKEYYYEEICQDDKTDLLNKAFFSHKQSEEITEMQKINNAYIHPPNSDAYNYLNDIADRLTLKSEDSPAPAPREFCDVKCTVY